MKKQIIIKQFRMLYVAGGLLFLSACGQNSTDHKEGEYSNGNPVTDSPATYSSDSNHNGNNTDSTGMSSRPTTAGDTMHNRMSH